MQSPPADQRKIEIFPYSDEWPRLFASQGSGLRTALGDVAARIDHVGSTSVPGLAAKPVIDIQISVAELEPLEESEDPRLLVGYGYLVECHGRNQLRRAAELYERAVELDSGYDKAHYQLISARAGLGELERTGRMYEQHLAGSPGDVRGHRFLAQAYLSAGALEKAYRVIEAGVELMPDDSALLAARGEAEAGLGDVDGALADWRRAVDLHPEEISGLYGSAFLLEREGRLEQAAEAWRAIAEWCQARGAWRTRPSGRSANCSACLRHARTLDRLAQLVTADGDEPAREPCFATATGVQRCWHQEFRCTAVRAV